MNSNSTVSRPPARDADLLLFVLAAMTFAVDASDIFLCQKSWRPAEKKNSAPLYTFRTEYALGGRWNILPILG
jgi:hypothetical protein